MVNLSDTSIDNDMFEGYDAPPAPTARIVELYRAWLENGNSSEHIPEQPLAAATWWVSMQEPRQSGEQTERTFDKRGNFTGWRTPYHDRISSTWACFLMLTEAQRAYIVHHVDDGIPWRGDPIPLYTSIVEQTHEMRENPDKYLANARAVQKEVTRGK